MSDLKKMIADEIAAALKDELAAVRLQVREAVREAVTGLGANGKGAPPAPSEELPLDERPKKRTAGAKKKQDATHFDTVGMFITRGSKLRVGDAVNGRAILARTGNDKWGGPQVSLRCQKCGSTCKISLEAAKNHGCKKCAQAAQAGNEPRNAKLRAKRSEVCETAAVALAEWLRGALEVGASMDALTSAELLKRISNAEWHKITGEQKKPDARVVGNGLSYMAANKDMLDRESLFIHKDQSQRPFRWTITRLSPRK